MRALVGDLVALAAVEQLDDVAFLGEFDAVLVGILVETPEHDAQAVGLTMIEAVSPAFLRDVFDRKIGLPSEGLHHLIEQSLGLMGIVLIDGNRLRARSRRSGPGEREHGQENGR